MWAGAPLRNAVRQGKECSKCQDESGGGGLSRPGNVWEAREALMPTEGAQGSQTEPHGGPRARLVREALKLSLTLSCPLHS